MKGTPAMIRHTLRASFIIAATALVAISPARAEVTGRYQELYDVCATSGDPTATTDYCSCSAEILSGVSDQEQLLLLSLSRLHIAGTLNETTMRELQTSLGLDDAAYQALLTQAGNTGSQADAACLDR